MLNVEALIPDDWKLLLRDYLASPDWQLLKTNLHKAIESDANAICPPPPLFFRALELTPVDAVSVVILGQDPYHSPGLAQGQHFQYQRRLCRAHALFRARCATSAKL
jgi:uracil-DNA glycosylase